MDVSELRAWTNRMGCASEIPDNFELLNESTAHIWKQVVERVRPRNEVRQIRHNNLLTKLRPQRQVALSIEVTECPSKVFNLWRKKEDLKQETRYEKEKYTEALRELKRVKQTNNELLIDIKATEIKLQESQLKTFVFNKHCGKLRVKVKDVAKNERFLNEIVSMLDARGESKDDIEKKVKCIALDIIVPSTLKDAMANKDVQSLYKNNQSNHLNDVVQCKTANLIHKINEISSNETLCTRQVNDIQEEQLNRNSKLHALHLESSLKSLRSFARLETLESRYRQEKREALDKLSPLRKQLNDVETFLEERLERLEGATINRLHAQTIADLQRDVRDATPRSGGRASHAKLSDALATKKQSLAHKARTHEQLARRVAEKRGACRELLSARLYACTLRFLAPLLSRNLETAEANVVVAFDLQYNRRCAFVAKSGAAKLYHRDACESRLPFVSDGAGVASASRALRLPVDDVEALKRCFVEKVARKRRYEEFARRCVHIQAEMQSNIDRDDSNDDNCAGLTRPLLDLSTYKFSSMKTISNTFDLWIEMPFSFYVPPSVLFDGKRYEFYEDAFDSV